MDGIELKTSLPLMGASTTSPTFLLGRTNELCAWMDGDVWVYSRSMKKIPQVLSSLALLVCYKNTAIDASLLDLSDLPRLQNSNSSSVLEQTRSHSSMTISSTSITSTMIHATQLYNPIHY
jgi:hypothetical protein